MSLEFCNLILLQKNSLRQISKNLNKQFKICNKKMKSLNKNFNLNQQQKMKKNSNQNHYVINLKF